MTGWLEKLRREALERFEALGFPTTRDEAWRFTDVSAIAALDLPYAAAESNGLSVAAFQGPLGRVASFEKHAFVALNTAFLQDVAYVHLPKGAAGGTVTIPFRARAGVTTHPRTLIVAEEGASATVVERYEGPEGEAYFTNAVTEIVLGEGAALTHIRLQREGKAAYHVATTAARQARGSRFTSYSIAQGAALSRHDLSTVLGGAGAEAELYGLYDVSGTQHVDHHTLIDHATPHATSRELYKGVLHDAARGVFDGRIIVRPDAQKTNAVQTNKNLLLSKQAIVNTKPQLEIFANDVKCKHGATIGQLDDEVLFYLRSRGIGLEEARRLLVVAFAGEIVDRVPVESVRALLAGVPA